jgi:hypothetical protein
MRVEVDVPKAFSVRDDHEMFVHQHLMARLNPKLRVHPIATGVHVEGGGTVFWGLVYAEGQSLTREDVEAALVEAGFDLKHNGPIQKLDLAAVKTTG